MPVYWKCPSCRGLNSLSRKTCSCGEKYPPPRERKYVVQVKHKGRRKSASVETLAQAREVEALLKDQLIKSWYLGQPEPIQCPTLGEFFSKQYLPWMKATLRHPDTAGNKLNKWVIPRLGGKKLDAITVQDVEKLKAEVISAGRSPRTVQHVLALLKALINKAKEWGLFRGENPVCKVKIPKFDNRRVRFLTHQEAKDLLQECRKRNSPRNHMYPIVLMALSTGMRAGEIFRLRWQDVDFQNDVIHIRDPKSGENRVAFLSLELKQELLPLKKGKSPSDFVFTNSRGKPFTAVPDVWKSIVKKLGFNDGVTDRRQKVVFHTLRHTFCSWLAMEGVPLHVIKELAGHKSIQVTERYSHLMPDMKRKAAEIIWKKLT